MEVRRALNLTVMLLLLLFLVVQTSLAAAEEEKRTLKREYDQVIVAGKQCGDITGLALAQYGLYRAQGGAVVPIPFQIDEVDSQGLMVLTYGPGKTQDEDRGRFDANDQLVFMAKDAGDRLADRKMLPGGATGAWELTLNDPISGEKGWVYLLTFTGATPRSPLDYVNYDAGARKITAEHYACRFGKKFPVVAEDYNTTKKLTGEEIALLDRVKVRIFMKQFITLKKTEEDIQVTDLGYIDGAVRVVTRTTNVTPLFSGIPASKTRQNTFFYYNQADFPFTIDFPIRPQEFRVLVIDDLADCIGCKFYSDKNPQGVTITGAMDTSQKSLDLSPWRWSAVSGNKVTFWSLVNYPPHCEAKAYLYFNDDRNAKDPKESVLGELPGVGYDLKEGWDRVKKFPIEYRFLHFFTTPYASGDEKAVVNIYDRPLKVSAQKVF